MLEGFSNPSWMEQADRVLKDIGREKAKEYYKVCEIVSLFNNKCLQKCH